MVGLTATVGAAPMGIRCHYHISAECLDGICDSFVVGSYDDLVEFFRSLSIYTLYHGHAAYIGQWFTGKTR